MSKSSHQFPARVFSLISINRLCDGHTSAQVEDLSRWLIVRDVLHALLVPVVELLGRAVALATCATHASKLENLENAFTGEARSAFVWLQRFLASEKEREWCYTRGCPACVVDHTLDSEYSVRLLFTSCLLSDVHYPFTIEGPTLPSFTFFLESLERALSEDPLYGRLVYERLQPKAMATRNGIEDLIQQCVELDAALRQEPSPFPSSSRASSALSTPVLGPLVPDPSAGEARTKVKRSKMARKHMCLPMEEECWMEEVLTETLDQLQLEGDSISVVGAPDELDAALKSKPTVCVNEIRAEG